MVKKIISVVLASVLLSLTLSGCDFIKPYLEYWDGMTKNETKSYVQEALKEKYGEEFIINYISTYSGEHYTILVGDCSPKSNKDIAFEIEANNFTKKRILYDGYIQAVVRQEIKEKVDSILSQNYNTFASEVEVRGISDLYDSGILSAEEATVKNYTEALPDKSITHIWIVLNETEINNNDKLSEIINKITENLYSMQAYIDVYYSTNDVINQCLTEVKNSGTDRLRIYVLMSGRYSYDSFVFDGKESKLYQVEKARNN